MLDQFGCDVSEVEYEPAIDKRLVLHTCIKSSSDEVIRELHAFLVGDDATQTSQIELPRSHPSVKLFISHRHEWRIQVGDLKDNLARNGLDAFVAHDDIHPNAKWQETIKEELRTCDALVAAMDAGFHSSQWCDQEVGWALGRDIPIIVLRLEPGARNDGFLGELQDLPYSSPPETACEILKSLLRDSRTNGAARSALVEAFVDSYSYNQTRSLLSMILAEDSFKESDLDRLRFAVTTNKQVYEASSSRNGETLLVPEVLKKFVFSPDHR